MYTFDLLRESDGVISPIWGFARGFPKAGGELVCVCWKPAGATRTDAVSVVVVPGTITPRPTHICTHPTQRTPRVHTYTPHAHICPPQTHIYTPTRRGDDRVVYLTPYVLLCGCVLL